MTRKPLDRYLLSGWFIALAILIGFYLCIGTVPLFDLDEGAFAEATREMLHSGYYLMTYLDGVPRFDKPILIYWFQAVSVLAFGKNEFAFRLPSALAATVWAWAIFQFVKARLGRDTAAVATLVMVNALVVSIIASAATADALLNMWLALIFFDIYRYYEQPSRRYIWRVYFWFGFAMLTKGPVGIFLPLVVSLVFFAGSKAMKPWLRAVFNPVGWLIFLVVALPWHVALYLDQGPAFFRAFFLKQNLGRFSSTMESHGGSIFYYFWVLPLSLLPFSGWLIRIFGRFRQGLADPLDRYLWCWFGVVFIFFSLSQTQLPHYMLYGATPLFILMARHRDALRNRWLAFVPALLLFALFLFLPELVALAAEKARHSYDAALLARGPEVFGWGYRVAVGICTALAIAAMVLWRKRSPWIALTATGVLASIALNGPVIEAAGALKQAPVRDAAAEARMLDLPTVAYRIRMPSFSVYRGAITPHRDPKPGDLVFTRIDRVDDIKDMYPSDQVGMVFREGGIVLLKIGKANG